jgi:hypothetical protein
MQPEITLMASESGLGADVSAADSAGQPKVAAFRSG